MWPPTWKDAEAAVSAWEHWFYDPQAPDKLQRRGTGCVANESQSSSSGPWLHLNELSEEKGKLSAAIWGESGHSYQYVAAVCGSWLGARVCQPRWSVGLVTQARSTQSLAGSGRINKHTVKGRKQYYGIYSAERLLNETVGFVTVLLWWSFQHNHGQAGKAEKNCRVTYKTVILTNIQMMNSMVKYDDVEGMFQKLQLLHTPVSWTARIGKNRFPKGKRWKKKYLTPDWFDYFNCNVLWNWVFTAVVPVYMVTATRAGTNCRSRQNTAAPTSNSQLTRSLGCMWKPGDFV